VYDPHALKSLAWVALISGVVSAAFYLVKSPLPKDEKL